MTNKRSGGGGDSDEGDKANQMKKKYKRNSHNDNDDQTKDNVTGTKEKSFKETLLGASSGQVSKDQKGRGVFDDAWAEYIKGLQCYFSKENADDKIHGPTKGVDIDDEDCPTLRITQEEYEQWCAPGRNSLIVKLLEKSVPLWVMKESLQKMWKTEKSFTTRDINNGYFLVSFEDENDMINIYQEGPWMVSDRYLVVQRWRLNFDPWNAELHKKIVIWLRIPLLPLEFFNAASFQRIGSLIGRTLKIDRVTYASERGKFARICVEIDLNKKLRSSFNLFGTRRRIEYEGLHLICFCCGVYGYHRDVCPERETHVVSNNNQAPNSTQEGSQEFSATHEQTRRYAESEQASINVEDGTAGEKRPRMVMESPTAAMGGAQPQKEGLGVWKPRPTFTETLTRKHRKIRRGKSCSKDHGAITC
ncbi:uncharacterized protein LOC114750879 [Neltuma alba]|uniref:uncharacterized protein LOC114750879 n=1 Tax=Neltuma alba TaxID=207710 RepID=UPI0010A2E64B|nr:uncharacterized protein LOC114750879 [Prosopis alba]